MSRRIKRGDEVIVQTETLYWAGVVARFGRRWVVLTGTSVVIRTGASGHAINSFEWQTFEPLPGDGVVRIARDMICVVVRKGGS